MWEKYRLHTLESIYRTSKLIRMFRVACFQQSQSETHLNYLVTAVRVHLLWAVILHWHFYSHTDKTLIWCEWSFHTSCGKVSEMKSSSGIHHGMITTGQNSIPTMLSSAWCMLRTTGSFHAVSSHWSPHGQQIRNCSIASLHAVCGCQTRKSDFN